MKRYDEVIPQDVRNKISTRYKRVTRAINKQFRGIESETQYSFYVGSYGRGTAIKTSDIDILVELPISEYTRFENAKNNGQSYLLQVVKNAIMTSYPKSDVRADGQVVKIDFSDGIQFEILPAFKQVDCYGNETYQYPDSNLGGNWKSTNPKEEQKLMKQKNKSSNELFYSTCKHIRSVRDEKFSSYKLSGIVIDTFVYHAMGDWHYVSSGTSSNNPYEYEHILLSYFNNYVKYTNSLSAVGSNESVNITSSKDCLEKILNHLAK